MREHPRADHRTVIVHIANSTEEQIGRIARLGAIVSTNPYCTVESILGQVLPEFTMPLHSERQRHDDWNLWSAAPIASISPAASKPISQSEEAASLGARPEHSVISVRLNCGRPKQVSDLAHVHALGRDRITVKLLIGSGKTPELMQFFFGRYSGSSFSFAGMTQSPIVCH